MPPKVAYITKSLAVATLEHAVEPAFCLIGCVPEARDSVFDCILYILCFENVRTKLRVRCIYKTIILLLLFFCTVYRNYNIIVRLAYLLPLKIYLGTICPYQKKETGESRKKPL